MGKQVTGTFNEMQGELSTAQMRISSSQISRRSSGKTHKRTTSEVTRFLQSFVKVDQSPKLKVRSCKIAKAPTPKPVIDPEALTAAERESRSLYTPQSRSAKKSGFLFDHLVIVGLSSAESTASEIIFQYPSETPVKVPGLADFCFPTGERAVQIPDSFCKSEIFSLMHNQQYLKQPENQFVFLFTDEYSEVYYGICVHKEELLEEPPCFMTSKTPNSPSPNSAATTIRCYCLITKFPFFRFHFDFLFSLFAIEHLTRLEMRAPSILEGGDEHEVFFGRDSTPQSPVASVEKIEAPSPTFRKAHGLSRSDSFTMTLLDQPDESGCNFVLSSSCSMINRNDSETDLSLSDNSISIPKPLDITNATLSSSSSSTVNTPNHHSVKFATTPVIAHKHHDKSTKKSADTISKNITISGAININEGLRPTLPAKESTSYEHPRTMSHSKHSRSKSKSSATAPLKKRKLSRSITSSPPHPSETSEVVSNPSPLSNPSASNTVHPCIDAMARFRTFKVPKGRRVSFSVSCYLNPISFARPYLDEKEELYAEWGLPLSCYYLSFDMLCSLISAILLEKKVIVLSSNLHLLSAAVLCFLPLIRPFTYRAVIIPMLPEKMANFLDAPVPFVVGAVRTPEDCPNDCVIVDVDNNKISSIEEIPPLPSLTNLKVKCSPYLDKLQALCQEPPYKTTKEQLSVVESICTTFETHFDNVFADFQKYTICNMSDPANPISIFLKDDFLADVSEDQVAFLEPFVSTQAFFEYSDKRLRVRDGATPDYDADFLNS